MMKMMMIWKISLNNQRKLEKKGDKIQKIIYLKKIKKYPYKVALKINDKTPIPNSQDLNKSSTFPQISNEQPLQPIYN